MPTPVSTARQCLTKEAEQALGEAVAVARRRGHAQTTSLHMVSSLLSLPSSALREACSRTRNNVYSIRVQFKALELCLGVSLDRLPSSPNRVEEPPVSNSLMAAIKRSQANQRRQPENFNFYQQQQLSSSSISVVKVELQNLILSILDDPVVSRVFAEAGFRSCEIKIAIVRPVHQLFRFSRYKGPPVFLSNLTSDNELGRKGFNFPFMGFSGAIDGDENCRRIAEVMVRINDGNPRRNPLLVGVYACDSLKSFLQMVQRRRGTNVLPVELSGLDVICIENDILRFLDGHSEEEPLKSRLEEVSRMVKSCVGPGVVVNFGDLRTLTGDNASVESLRILVINLATLLEVHRGKVWLIGSAATYETFLKFLNMFPTIEKDWDLQLLSITTLRLSTRESHPRSSLMESFVPFGGFFSTPSDMKSTLRSSSNSVSRCHVCNVKCGQEVSAISNGEFSPSVADHYRSTLPSWLQMSEYSSNCGLDIVKAKDDSLLLSSRIAGLRRKWDDICQRLHQSQQSPKANSYELDPIIPSVVEFQVLEDRKTSVSMDSSSHTNASLTGTGCKKNADSRDEENFAKASSPSFLSKASSLNFLSKFDDTPSEVREKNGLGSPFNTSTSISNVGDGLTSLNSVTSITLDLNLEFDTACRSSELEKSRKRNHVDIVQDFSFCSSANPEVASRTESSNLAKSSFCSHPYIDEQFDQKDIKTVYASLTKRIGRQEEAVKVVSQTLARCKTVNEKRSRGNRRDIWFYFLGPDKLAKKEFAMALAEILHGSRENLLQVDLGFQDEISYSGTISDNQVSYRGKNVVDYIAEKLSKKPLSVVYLENIDKADLLLQHSLSKAVKTGRFPDSYGREISIANALFVTASTYTDGDPNPCSVPADYCEEDILEAKGWPIQMIIGFDLRDDFISMSSSKSDPKIEGNPNRIILNKRKLIGKSETREQCSNLEMAKGAHRASDADLDLNCPAEESEICDTCPGNSESDSNCDNSRAWLEHFSGQVDATVVFQPFDFDALSQKIIQDISECFRKIVSSECSLEIDSRVMTQMLAAACLIDTKMVEEWVQQVLGSGFGEAQQKYSLTARSTVKLVACEGPLLKGQALDEFLPSRIILN